MSIPKRGRRSITVDGAKYHYMVHFERSERAVIQNAHACGAFLFVFPFAIMKPSHVADAIRYAISCGWVSSRKGEEYWLAFGVDADGGSHFEHIPNQDFRATSYRSKGRLPADMDASQFDDIRPWYSRPSPAANN